MSQRLSTQSSVNLSYNFIAKFLLKLVSDQLFFAKLLLFAVFPFFFQHFQLLLQFLPSGLLFHLYMSCFKNRPSLGLIQSFEIYRHVVLILQLLELRIRVQFDPFSILLFQIFPPCCYSNLLYFLAWLTAELYVSLISERWSSSRAVRN